MFNATEVSVIVNTSSWIGTEVLSLDSAIRNKYEILALRKSVVPIGEWHEKWHGDILKKYRDAYSVWDVYEPFTIPAYRIQDSNIFGVYEKVKVAGDFCRLEKGYESEVVSLSNGDGDYCLYCGGWNGSEGQYRLGWDCCHCGSN